VSTSFPTKDGGGYISEALAVDKALDEQLAIFRRELDNGEIDAIDGANERVKALEAHLATIRALRVKYFGRDAGSNDHD